MERKEYIEVIAYFDTVGTLKPLKIRLSDGSCHIIDKVLEIRNCADLKLGGIGVRYLVSINDTKLHLYLQDGKWYMHTQYQV